MEKSETQGINGGFGLLGNRVSSSVAKGERAWKTWPLLTVFVPSLRRKTVITERGEGVGVLVVWGEEKVWEGHLGLRSMTAPGMESESQHLETSVAVGIAVMLLSYFTKILVYTGFEIRISGPSQQIV